MFQVTPQPRPVLAELRLELPLPYKSLSPNARCHWAAKAKAVRTARWETQIAARAEMILRPRDEFPWPSAIVQPTFFFKTAARRDRDNCAASLKAHIDGLADAGVVANDIDIMLLPPIILKDAKKPRLELTITKGV